jgi:hypothetical protein
MCAAINENSSHQRWSGYALVEVMKTAHLGDGNDATLGGRLDVSGEGGVLTLPH